MDEEVKNGDGVAGGNTKGKDGVKAGLAAAPHPPPLQVAAGHQTNGTMNGTNSRSSPVNSIASGLSSPAPRVSVCV